MAHVNLFLNDLVLRGKHKDSILHEFYIRGSVHLNCSLKKSNEMQQYADIYLLLNYSTCFGCPSRPSSGVHETVVARWTPDKASAEPATCVWVGGVGVGVGVGAETTTLKFVVGSFELDSSIRAEGSLRDPCYKIGE